MDKRTINIYLDVVVIILIVIAAAYLYFNWSWINYLFGSDFCKICSERTGAVCSKVILK
jgi:hypothetical protein